MTAPSIYILGGTQTDFARHFAREGKDLAAVVGDTVDAALDDARVAPEDIGCIHVGNAFGEVFVAQAQLGAMPATARPALVGVPATRHEAACASGGTAVLAAMADLECGRYDVALVLGVEQEKNLSGEAAARAMGTAAWTGHEGEGARYLWPHMFARLADVYAERFGLDARHLAAIARKNLGNARHNGLAQTRAWRFAESTFAAGWEDDAANAPVAGRLRRLDCAQVSDGAAAVVLASARGAERWAAARGVRMESLARIAGWGHRTAGLGLEAKLAAPGASGHVFPHLRACAHDAWRRAGIGLEALHLIELHDCFSITEYMLIDHLDITAPGEAWKALEDGRLERGGRLPINPSGGLIGGGHPVGATGVRMLHDAARQVTGRAGDAQVPGARWAGTLNIGGSATTVVAFAVNGPGVPA